MVTQGISALDGTSAGCAIEGAVDSSVKVPVAK
jgi:hypothetical protein